MEKDKLKDVLLNCKFEKYESDSADARFSKAKIWVAHTGWNYNSTYFSKEMLQDMAENSLGGIPLVAFLQKDEDNKDFAGHEEIAVLDEDDNIKFVYVGIPFGFVPKQPDWSFETKDVNGESVEYLVVNDVEIWNKFDGSELFDDTKGQSMELLPDDLDGTYTTELPSNHEALVDGREGWFVTSATFDALCALGDNYEPAMKGSVIEKFSNKFTKNGFKQSVQDMFAEYAKELDKGGEDMGKKTEENYELNFDEKLKLLDEKLKSEGTFVNDWHEETHKFMAYTADSEYVFYWDMQDDWKLYGASYTMTDGEVIIDMENSFEVVNVITPKSDAFEKDISVKSDNFAKVVSDFLNDKFEAIKDEKIKELTEKHSGELSSKEEEYSKDLETKDSEIKKLGDFKAKVLRNQRTDYVNSVANLNEDERKILIENIDEYTMETLEDEVAKIIGKKSVKFTKNIQTTISDEFVEEEESNEEDDDDYNRFVKKYSRKNEEE
jgi:hypothetical protein